MTVVLHYRSTLAAPTLLVWDAATSIAGINAETMPIFRMTTPPGIANLTDIAFEPGKVLFRSRVLVLGFIPFDWSDLALAELEPGRRFVERSRMGSMRSWQHIRTIEPWGSGCSVTDELSFEPKWPPVVAKAMIDLAFRNRHRRLKRRFGVAESG
jgi:ligand-binding SRPBCC domain-containing protein